MVQRRRRRKLNLREQWRQSGTRKFWMYTALGLLGLSGWWFTLGPMMGFSYHPMRALVAGAGFVLLGLVIGVCDDGGIESEPF